MATKKSKLISVRYILSLIIFFITSCFYAQDEDFIVTDSLNQFCFDDYCVIDASTKEQYPFIIFEKNNFQFYSDRSPNWENLYQNLAALDRGEYRKLNFYHIGGSHIQADIYSHDVRTFWQTHWRYAGGERGIVFPFNLARTNNPVNYIFNSSNNWQAYRSVVHRPAEYDYGVMGAVLTCSDSVINIAFRHNRSNTKPSFCKLRIYHNKGFLPYELNFGAEEILVESCHQNERLGYTEIWFTDPIDTLDLQFSRSTDDRQELQIHGFQFMNDEPGISYTSIGINGAGLYTYLVNKNFEEQLKQYPPDVFTFSVGTNDGNVPYDDFDPQVYKNNMEKMMLKVLAANSKCAILLTVPNDSYYKRKYLNRNIAREREVIIELAEKYKIPVWDFYGVMGELGSSKIWHKNGLMQADLLHFTGLGYHLKGTLLTDAFLKFMNQMEVIEQLKKTN